MRRESKQFEESQTPFFTNPSLCALPPSVLALLVVIATVLVDAVLDAADNAAEEAAAEEPRFAS